MKKIAVIGHFGFGKKLLNGQTVKTKVITDELERVFGENEIVKIDTCGGIINLFKSPIQVFKAFFYAKNIIILPAHNGLRVYAPLLAAGKVLFRNRDIHYVVIGGWLADFLENKNFLKYAIKFFKGIYVETSTMKRVLEKMGFQNVIYMPNCKKLIPLTEKQLINSTSEPYKLCTFSRVMKEKGIEDAMEAIEAINNKHGRIVYTLDIYGQVEKGQELWFDHLRELFPKYVSYRGMVAYDQSVDVLKEYWALLFPTRFYTEGVPGTILDAYAAGVPVISSKWESFGDVVDDGVTGFGYEFSDISDLEKVLENLIGNDMINMKKNCITKAEAFLPENVIMNAMADYLR